MEVNITALAATITALGVVFGAVFGIYRWFLKQEKQDKDIKAIKEELGDVSNLTDDVSAMREMLEKNPYPEHVKEKAKEEIQRYELLRTLSCKRRGLRRLRWAWRCRWRRACRRRNGGP